MLDSSLQNRVLIRELIANYSDAVFRRDVEAYLQCWAPDGVRIGQGEEVRGKDALRSHWNAIWTVLDRMAFFTESVVIDVTDDRAKARCYCREILFLKAGGMRKVVGIYSDDLFRRNGAWVFARRQYELYMDEGQVERAPA